MSKDFGFFTRHFEKVVLALGMVGLAAIVVLYVIGEPYAVEVRNQQLNAAALEEQIRQTARELDQKLKDYDAFPRKQVFPYAETFTARVDDPAAPLDAYSESVFAGGLHSRFGEPPVPPEPYDLPRPPMPYELAVYDGYSVFNPVGGDLTSEQASNIYQMIGSRRPADFAYVSVQAKFDLDHWQARLADSDRPNPVPRRMWRGKLELTAVYLQRQQLNPATGQWSEPTTVATLPTQIAFTPQFTREYTDAEARDFVEFIKQNQQSIARSDFIPLASYARQWTPPAAAGNLSAEDHRRLDQLNREIANLQQRIDTLEEQAGMADQRAQRPGASPASRSSPFDGGPSPSTSVRTRPGATGGATREQEIQQELDRLRGQVVEAQAQRNELLGITPDIIAGDANSQYGVPPYGEPGSRGYQPGRSSSGTPTGLMGLEQPAEPIDHVVNVWAHDLTVQRGRTYRYRLLVSVINPLFREARVEAQQREENYNKIALGPSEAELDASPWTEPVEVESQYEFFLVSGTAQQQLATVEVWRYYDGMPRKATFTVLPGDRIGGVELIDGRQIDMHVGAVLVDLVSDANRGGLGAGTRMLYIRQGEDQIRSRSLEADRDSDERLRLENERQLIQSLSGPLASAPPAAPAPSSAPPP